MSRFTICWDTICVRYFVQPRLKHWHWTESVLNHAMLNPASDSSTVCIPFQPPKTLLLWPEQLLNLFAVAWTTPKTFAVAWTASCLGKGCRCSLLMKADQGRGIWSDEEEMRSLMKVGAEESVFLKPWRFCRKIYPFFGAQIGKVLKEEYGIDSAAFLTWF